MTFSASNSQSLFDDTLAKVDYIDVSCHDPPVQVYNFVVKDFHTYYVSEDCVLVHNDKNGCAADSGSKAGNSLKKIKNNKEANKIAKELGYDGAEDLKKAFVDTNGSHFNMMIDTETREIVLVSIKKSSVKVHTELYR